MKASQNLQSLEVNSLFNVSGKTALVTGGGQGIGNMISAGLVQNGCRVIICSRNKKQLAETESELNGIAAGGGGGSCESLEADLGTLAGVKGVVAALAERKVEKLHICVNNSGMAWGEPLEGFSEKGWDRVMNVNVKGLFFLTQAVVPLLRSAATPEDPARIINIGSVAGFKPQTVPTYSYDVSKAAVHHLTKKLASDLSGDHITVNAIAPGLVPSKMSNQLLTYAGEERLRKGIPLNRLGRPGDMAGTALFLCSRAGSWVTGQVIAVDGGFLVDVRAPASKL